MCLVCPLCGLSAVFVRSYSDINRLNYIQRCFKNRLRSEHGNSLTRVMDQANLYDFFFEIIARMTGEGFKSDLFQCSECFFITPGNLIPVDDLPECIYIFSTAVLVLKIISMFPYIY